MSTIPDNFADLQAFKAQATETYDRAITNTHWGANHHYNLVPGCEMCAYREWTHAHGNFPHKFFHEGCVQCKQEHPDLPKYR